MDRNHIIAICGVKNTGKSTVIENLLPILIKRGHKVAVIKHDAHDFAPDVPGTDTYRYKQAGAYGTAIFSKNKYMMVKEEASMTAERLADMFPEADLIIIEGLKYSDYPKIELVRGRIAEDAVCDPATVLAYISDTEQDSALPVLKYDQLDRIAGVIETFLENAAERSGQ